MGTTVTEEAGKKRTNRSGTKSHAQITSPPLYSTKKNCFQEPSYRSIDQGKSMPDILYTPESEGQTPRELTC